MAHGTIALTEVMHKLAGSEGHGVKLFAKVNRGVRVCGCMYSLCVYMYMDFCSWSEGLSVLDKRRAKKNLSL